MRRAALLLLLVAGCEEPTPQPTNEVLYTIVQVPTEGIFDDYLR